MKLKYTLTKKALKSIDTFERYFNDPDYIPISGYIPLVKDGYHLSDYNDVRVDRNVLRREIFISKSWYSADMHRVTCTASKAVKENGVRNRNGDGYRLERYITHEDYVKYFLGGSIDV